MTYTVYSDLSGVFVNNVTPASAANMNAIRSFLLAGWFDSAITSNGAGVLSAAGVVTGAGLLSLTPRPTVKTGSTSGTMTSYEYCTGALSLKVVLLNLVNYRQAAASANTIALGAAFTIGGWVLASDDIPSITLLASASQITMQALLTLGSTAPGTSGNTTILHGDNVAQFGPFDSISEPGSNSAVHTSRLLFIGV